MSKATHDLLHKDVNEILNIESPLKHSPNFTMDESHEKKPYATPAF